MNIFVFGLLIGTTFSLLREASTTGIAVPDVVANVVFLVAFVILSQFAQLMISEADKQRENEILKNKIRNEIEKYVESHYDSQNNTLLDTAAGQASGPQVDTRDRAQRLSNPVVAAAGQGKIKSYGTLTTTL